MGTRFDETTAVMKANFAPAFADETMTRPDHWILEHERAFAAGRDSCLESILVMAKALEDARHAILYDETERGFNNYQKVQQAIAEVKAAGNWPLEDAK
jgi:hypothetical protein